MSGLWIAFTISVRVRVKVRVEIRVRVRGKYGRLVSSAANSFRLDCT